MRSWPIPQIPLMNRKKQKIWGETCNEVLPQWSRRTWQQFQGRKPERRVEDKCATRTFPFDPCVPKSCHNQLFLPLLDVPHDVEGSDDAAHAADWLALSQLTWILSLISCSWFTGLFIIQFISMSEWVANRVMNEFQLNQFFDQWIRLN